MVSPSAGNDEAFADNRHRNRADDGHKLAIFRAQLQNAIAVFRILKQHALHRAANHLFFLPRHVLSPSSKLRKAARASERKDSLCPAQKAPPPAAPVRITRRKRHRPCRAQALPHAAMHSSAAAAPTRLPSHPETAPLTAARKAAAAASRQAPRPAPESPRTRARRRSHRESPNHLRHILCSRVKLREIYHTIFLPLFPQETEILPISKRIWAIKKRMPKHPLFLIQISPR